MTDPMELVGRATEASDLRDRIMNPNVAKSEAEWWASREIERLEACIREMVEWREGMVLVPRVPTDAMLQGACKSHIPGQSMGTIRGFEHGECPSFERRRRIWADMVSAALPPAPGAEDE